MKNRIETKICGISTTQAIDALIAGGSTHLGFIFFEKSPRHVSIEKAKMLSEHAGEQISKVVVTVNASDEYLGEIIEAVRPDIVQLHGSETPERVTEIKSKFGLPVMKALAIHEPADLEKIKPYIAIADRFLFDAKPPKGSEIPGGNGVAFDWEIMDHLPENVSYMLSGGLDAENIEQAIAKSGANAIDISSGVERAPGEKDIALIEQFLAKVS